MKNLLLKIHKGTIGLENGILLIICIVLPIIIFISVILRYIVHRNFDGLTEIVVILVSWLYFTGSAVAAYQNCHINASILDMFVKRKKSFAIMQTVRQVISLFFYGVIFVLAMNNVTWMLQSKPRTPMLRLPQVIMYIPIAICFFLSSLYTIAHIVEFVREARNTDASELIEEKSAGSMQGEGN